MRNKELTIGNIQDFDEEGKYEGKRGKRTSFEKEVQKKSNEKLTLETIKAIVKESNENNAYVEAERSLSEDMIQVIMNEYGFDEETSGHIYNLAYNEGHSSGIYEIYNYTGTFADFAGDIIKSVNKVNNK